MGHGLNKVQLLGRLGKDPEVRFTEGGAACCNFSIATDEKWEDKSGKKQERTEWHRCVAWGKQAEVIGQYAAKGKRIFVEGSLQTRDWLDKKTNEKKYVTEIKVRDFTLIDFKDKAPDATKADGTPMSDEEIPF